MYAYISYIGKYREYTDAWNFVTDSWLSSGLVKAAKFRRKKPETVESMGCEDGLAKSRKC